MSVPDKDIAAYLHSVHEQLSDKIEKLGEVKGDIAYLKAEVEVLAHHDKHFPNGFEWDKLGEKVRALL